MNSDSPVDYSDTQMTSTPKPSLRGTALYHIQLRGQTLVCLEIENVQRLCLAQISSTLLRNHSYNEIHNRRVALGINCVQCTPTQLEALRESGAMPVSSRRCGTITLREAERLVKSFLDEPEHPRLPENFAFNVVHYCGWGCRGQFIPNRYNSSRAKCVRCNECQIYLSPNKFVFHSHTPSVLDKQVSVEYRHPDAANFNAWRRHLYLDHKDPSMELVHAWEDVKAMFNGGNRKRTQNFQDTHSVFSDTSYCASPPPRKAINLAMELQGKAEDCSVSKTFGKDIDSFGTVVGESYHSEQGDELRDWSGSRAISTYADALLRQGSFSDSIDFTHPWSWMFALQFLYSVQSSVCASPLSNMSRMNQPSRTFNDSISPERPRRNIVYSIEQLLI